MNIAAAAVVIASAVLIALCSFLFLDKYTEAIWWPGGSGWRMA